MTTRILLVPALLTSLCLSALAAGQMPALATPHARISRNIDDNTTVTLQGNVHPLAAAANSSQGVADSTPMEHMILYLTGDTTQETQLAQLITQQNDPKSSLYHKFLTPNEFGAQFGIAQSDIQKVTAWLQDQGFTIDRLAASNRAIVFSGTSGQVAQAFKTEIRQYTVGGVVHYANASDPQIPAALAGTVGGIVKLHDFKHGHSITKTVPVSSAQLKNPQFDYGSSHYLAPADYGMLYDINPLYAAGVNGAGQTIAVIARSNIYLSDVETFRSTFGLSANNPQIVITNSDPGVLEGDSVETTLDTEWSGAVAPNATIKVIVAASTTTADGVDLSALYAVDNNVAPIISLSYGSCEADMGVSELAFYNSLWKQAASQGISVMVAAGDSGAAGCSGGSDSSGSGQAINGLCSSPYSTCVGGTEFVDGTNPGQYWLPGNNTTYGSAIGYIPETVWNESASNGGSGLWAGGGGASITYAKPSWQTGPGVPADGKRDVPDVSLTAAGHDGYLIWLYGSLNSVGGTSAAAPSFAGIMALVDQKTNTRQGLANSILYPLAVKQASNGAAIFHDIQTGNNSVPGVTGFSATVGYDLASGLGSVDANLLVTHWTDGSAPTAPIVLTASSTALTVKLGQAAQTTVTSTATSLNAAVALTVAGAPAGVTATFSSAAIASPGSGSVTLNISVGSTAKPGSYPLTINAAGGGKTATLSISVTIPAPTFTLSLSAPSASVTAGNSGQAVVSVTPVNGFSATVALSATGLPSGVTAAFSPTSLAGTAGGTSTLTLAIAKTATTGTYSLNVNATGGGITQTSTLSLAIVASASCTLTSNPASVNLLVGQSASTQVTCGVVKGTFTGPLTLSISGAPTGVTTKTTATTLAAGSSTTLTISSLSTTKPGNYTLSVTAGGTAFTQTLAIPLIIPAPTFLLSAGAPSLSVIAGTSALTSVTVTPQNAFNSSVKLSIAGLPAGVAATFSSPTVSGTAPGVSALTLGVTSSVKGGSYPLVITAAGGGVTQTYSMSLVVTLPAICNLTATPGTVTLTAGQSTSLSLSCPVLQGSFTAPLSLSLSEVPTGITAQLASTAMAPGSSITLNISAPLTTGAGSHSLTVTATGSEFSRTISIPLTVTVPSVFAIAPVQSAITITNGASGQVNVSSLCYGAFNSAVALSFSGLPSGVTAGLSSAALAAPGSGSVLATFGVSSAAKAGVYPITVSGTGGGQTHSAVINLTIGSSQNFTLSLSVPALTIARGSQGTVIVSTGNFTGGFNSTISISFSGLAPGMNWGVTGASTGNNLVNVADSFSAASYTPVGIYPVTVTATGNGISHSATVQMTIK